MNYVHKLFVSFVMLVSFSSFGMVHQIIRDENGYRVFDGKQEQIVKSHFIDPLLKRMSFEQLKTFIEQGNRIRVIRLSNGEHRLQSMVHGNGGGPISGLIAYWATKSLCYGTAAAAATTAVVATGGAAAAFATGAAATVAAGSVAAGAGTAIVVGGATAEVAAGVIAGGLAASAGMVEGAALATTAVVSSAGTVAAAVAAVETASFSVGAFFTALPFLP